MSYLSINLTIHNKGFLIERVLERIKKHTAGPFELVIVLDGCTDDSEWKVRKFCALNPQIKTIILEAPNVFETKANNLAARASTGDHIIIIQDDVLLNEFGWEKRILSPFFLFSDVFSVSGRTAHNWNPSLLANEIMTEAVRNDRWCEILIATNHASREHESPRNHFSIRDTCNRSPLAINRADLETMGYFDEAFAPLDSCDHDLHYRMHKKLEKVCGGLWIDYESRPEWGGTRNASGIPHPWMYEAQQKNSRELYRRHGDYMRKNCLVETRIANFG